MSEHDHRHHTRHRPADPSLPLGYQDDVPFEHDPLDPHPEEPTPIDLVVRLTRSQRERRVERLVEIAQARFAEALATHGAEKTIAGVCALVSGGNDSYTIAHLFRHHLTVERILAGPEYAHIPDHRKRWGWGAYFDEPDAVVPMGTDSLCGTNCGPDPIADFMDPLFNLEESA